MSLQHIVLRDFVIVRELDLNLSHGFTVEKQAQIV